MASSALRTGLLAAPAKQQRRSEQQSARASAAPLHNAWATGSRPAFLCGSAPRVSAAVAHRQQGGVRSVTTCAAKVVGQIKLALQAGKANPAPPVGPALGSKGVNIMAFCKEYNAKTADKVGQIIPVAITVYDDKSFTLELKTPPASFLLKEKAGIKAGSAKGQKVKVGKVTTAQVSEIAQIKMRDLNCGGNLESGMAIIKGTARNMGIDVVG